MIINSYMCVGKWRVSFNHERTAMEEIPTKFLRFRRHSSETMPILDNIRSISYG